MKNNNDIKPSHFYVVGLSYKKADAEMRGKFSLSEQAKLDLLADAHLQGISSVMAISTCNRTELYGFAEHPFQLISLLCAHSSGTIDDFQRVAYVHKNNEAVSHLFKVGTGMDSQILGDFEIISQVKTGFIAAREKGLTNNYFERLVNSVIQASKRIKNETEISTGATSVSFASVHYILKNVSNIKDKNILLFGTGKIGRNTCENLVKHTKNSHITLINRTKDKAQKIAGKFNLIVKDYADLQAEIQNTDVLIVATGAQNPTIDKELLNLKKPLLILDLSIPKNVNENVLETNGVELIHLDTLSQMTDDTLEKRKQYVPQAMAIIEEVKHEFITWTQARKFAPTIHALKAKLEEMKQNELKYHKKKINNFDEEQAELITSRLIQKITTHFANHLKDDETEVDESIEWIGKVFQLESLQND
ncbi:glutamyl-tRNA reductase [Flavobacterium sp. CBA20B-1]|uniref:Glutamyl-tRNA reductase n=1 Tax=Paenimyroides aestuarii TaxID=2968490 RepID=A0ABY5NW02_9FLAO|nr:MULTISPECIES: glutamyl-tRNA reductase [Flavobacteriaceae]UUV22766.1 glutamyl-tRNA reductase [Paenimyroides aestuarii]WCM43429.1 glutamyl-tRNA reductase [Flavobacterium sp. CBA20B-1]